jgi:Reverse transcriptase (RNA-dependent DNA polymerase)
VENNQPGRELILDRANLALNVTGKPKDPGLFDEAYNNPNLEERAKLREAIQRELKEMEDKGVYKKIEKSELPDNCVCVKNKWIFKVKRNGIFRAQLVACWCSQVPGIDFQESVAPIMNDVTLRIMLIIMLVWNLKGKVVDIETAVLHGELKEKIYKHLPDGLEGDN